MSLIDVALAGLFVVLGCIFLALSMLGFLVVMKVIWFARQPKRVHAPEPDTSSQPE